MPNIVQSSCHPWPQTFQTLWVGIGCKRGSSEELLHWSVIQALAKYSLAKEAIAGFATLDRKAQEPGLIALAARWHVPLIPMSVATLSEMTVPNPAGIVAQAVGTSSVAEAAALAAALRSLERFLPVFSGVLPKLFPKQIYRLPDQPGVVTIAIAETTPT